VSAAPSTQQQTSPMDPQEPLGWIDLSARMFADAVAKHGHVALLYSGGIESCLLLRLAAPLRDRITAYTVRTGAEFPHMVTFVDRQLKGWGHRVITVDLVKSFDQFGLPASAVPIEHVPGVAASLNIDERRPRIVPWTFCCVRNRWEPGCEAIKRDVIGAAIHGQRAADFPKPSPLEYPGLELVAPLWLVSRDEVWRAIRELEIELPDHYTDYPNSLDCSVCPWALTTPRRAWMAKHYPDHLAVAEQLHSKVSQAVVVALDGDNTRNAYDVQ
jgi:3'-phosphoadenosine 5'-phosphosulfate sulfotransferase (PAPS reductase)/FAD synthetase